MNPSKAKGTKGEVAAAKWLTDITGIPFKRREPQGNNDKGDVRGDGLDWLVIEVKNCATPALPKWTRELKAEMANAGASHGVILWSPPGVGMGHVDQWVALEQVDTVLRRNTHVIEHYGPVTKLHKFVAHMEVHGTGVQVGPLVSHSAEQWGMWLCDTIARRAAA